MTSHGAGYLMYKAAALMTTIICATRTSRFVRLQQRSRVLIFASSVSSLFQRSSSLAKNFLQSSIPQVATMVRFISFVAALMTLGATVGAHVPSSKGEWAVLFVPHAESN